MICLTRATKYLIQINQASIWTYGKVVVSHGSKQAHSQSKCLHDHQSVNCAISAAGAALPPMVIFKKSFTSSAYIIQGPIKALYVKSPNG